MGSFLLLPLGVAVAVGVLAALNKPKKPAILRGVSAGGGWWSGGCPAEDENSSGIVRRFGEALSPELNERIRRKFTAGDDGHRLEAYLKAQGFRAFSPCPNDASIKRVIYEGGGNLFEWVETTAIVSWKENETGKIIWTKGLVSYGFL